MRRKAKANWALLTHTPVNAVVPFATAYLGWLVARPRGRLAAAIRWRPALGAGLGAVVVMGAVGLLVNDSGDAVPAMAMLVAIPYAVAVIGRLPERLGGDAGDGADGADGADPSVRPAVRTAVRHAGDRARRRRSTDPGSPVLP